MMTMKRVRSSTLLVALGGMAVSMQAAAEESMDASAGTEPAEQGSSASSNGGKSSGTDHSQPGGWYGGGPVSELLPKGVFRNRFVYGAGQGSSGFDSKGKKVSNGITAGRAGGAEVLEYGITDKLTFQFIAPVVMTNTASLDAAKFRKSELYQTKYDSFVTALGSLLLANGACATQEACEEKVQSGYTLPVDTQVTLPTGETLTIKRGTVAADAIDSTILTAAAPSQGQTGISDITFGLGYNVLGQGPFQFAGAVGMRLPTGTFEKVPAAQRPTGAGMTALGFRTLTDFVPAKGVDFGWDNTFEMALSKAKRRKSSLVDPSRLNEGDPTSASAIAAGSDGEDNNQEIKWDGYRNVGYIAAKAALGYITPALWFAGLDLGVDYDYYPAVKTDGVETSAASELRSAFATLGMGTFFAGPVPYRLEFKQSTPIGGKNVLIAAPQTSMQLHVFMKF